MTWADRESTGILKHCFPQRGGTGWKDVGAPWHGYPLLSSSEREEGITRRATRWELRDRGHPLRALQHALAAYQQFFHVHPQTVVRGQ